MLRYRGGDRVNKGTYWNLAEGVRMNIEREGVLPGDGSTTYLRVPLGVMVLLGPLIGLVYVISLPFIALATVLVVVTEKLLEWLLGVLWKSISFGWRPGTAYLSGKKRDEKKNKERD